MFIGGGGIPLGIDPDDEFYGIDWSKIDFTILLSSEMTRFLLAGVSY